MKAQPSDSFSGTTRGAYIDETIGAFFQLREIWKKFEAKIVLNLHEKGHEDMVADAFKIFLYRLPE